MGVDLHSRQQFVGRGLGDECFNPPFDGVRSTDHGIGQRLLDSLPLQRGDQSSSKLSTGGGKGPGVPRRAGWRTPVAAM